MSPSLLLSKETQGASAGPRRRQERCARLLDALLVGSFVLFLPSACWAWGPAAHLDFGLQVLQSLPLLPPLLRHLLPHCSADYLYGCVAADIVVGKNMARHRDHCHNWQVALRLLDRARTEPQLALAYGFLSHLAADVVAHNYFVPLKTVQSFSTKTTGHTYWEVRFDQLTHSSPRVWATLREVGRTRHEDHDWFMACNLKGASRLFPFNTSRRIFSGMLTLSRLEPWRRTAATLADRSPWRLDLLEIRECYDLSVELSRSILADPDRSCVLRADPTGAASLRAARQLRRQLRRLGRHDRLDTGQWLSFCQQVKSSLRRAIGAPLRLPPAWLVARAA